MGPGYLSRRSAIVGANLRIKQQDSSPKGPLKNKLKQIIRTAN